MPPGEVPNSLCILLLYSAICLPFLGTFTLALGKVFASYIKLGAIPGHFSLSSTEKMDEFTDDSSCDCKVSAKR